MTIQQEIKRGEQPGKVGNREPENEVFFEF